MLEGCAHSSQRRSPGCNLATTGQAQQPPHGLRLSLFWFHHPISHHCLSGHAQVPQKSFSTCGTLKLTSPKLPKKHEKTLLCPHVLLQKIRSKSISATNPLQTPPLSLARAGARRVGRMWASWALADPEMTHPYCWNLTMNAAGTQLFLQKRDAKSD